MHFQFLIEDRSGEVLIDQIMKRVIKNAQVDTYDCKPFSGIGGFTFRNTNKETHTGKLLNDLVTYMRGFQRSLRGIEAVLMVVLDNDKNDPDSFLLKLESVVRDKGIVMDHVFCLAIEEVEAWLLGDEDAIKKAYPNYRKSEYNKYEQDSICGTWEVLADVVHKGGMRDIKKKKMSYGDIGKLKSIWASEIGKYMTYEKNRSSSFQSFINNIIIRISD